MFKVLDKLRIGNKYIVSVEGDILLLKNGLKLIDEKGNIFEIYTIGMPHYENIKYNKNHAELVLKGDIEKMGEYFETYN